MKMTITRADAINIMIIIAALIGALVMPEGRWG